MKDYYQAQIDENIYMIEKGCKPLSVITIPKKYRKIISTALWNHNLIHDIKDLDDNWLAIYICKHPVIMEIIKDLPDKPTTPADHYLLGALFGYSNDQILKFISKKIESPNPVIVDKEYLYNAFNATCQGDGNGDVETYENWLERQLINRITKEKNY